MSAPTAAEARTALTKARILVQQAHNARGRMYRRTGGTATQQREFDKAAEYDDRADEQFAIVEAYLARGEA